MFSQTEIRDLRMETDPDTKVDDKKYISEMHMHMYMHKAAIHCTAIAIHVAYFVCWDSVFIIDFEPTQTSKYQF